MIPVAGTLLAVSVPLVRYAARDRDERVAIEVVRRISDAQREFRAGTGGYATDVASLTATCAATPAPLSSDVFDRLRTVGYVLHMRAAAGETVGGTDCHGRALASDYYLAVAPASADVAARQAIATRSDGRLFLFHDGIAPTEADIATGLPTPVEERESFKIP